MVIIILDFSVICMCCTLTGLIITGGGFMIWGFILAMISGTLMSVQGVFNAEVTKQTSVWVSASFVQFTALIVCLAAWFFTGREGSLGGIISVNPKYMLLGGAMGAFITFTVIQSMNQLGPAKATIFIVTLQLVVSYVIELFGLFGVDKVDFEWKKLLGLAAIVVGIIVFRWD